MGAKETGHFWGEVKAFFWRNTRQPKSTDGGVWRFLAHARALYGVSMTEVTRRVVCAVGLLMCREVSNVQTKAFSVFISSSLRMIFRRRCSRTNRISNI